ncbi:hypothetical protein HQ602_18650 [Rhodococcus kroppenstedtii]|uniref:hypothetical protein n=1 Tax=Rhodococcoides kroppenstedtii TaxID=293050 RepID=UPI001C9BB290|nr:hypothetical protein [Rhodococcus kroppenstedtii]MBY6438396.1 hypothetical protein [Rhodococcus kroppenstedtii]
MTTNAIPPPVQTLTLAASTLVVQYRSDCDFLRIVAAKDADTEDDWGPVSTLLTTDPQSFPTEHRQQVWPGDSPDPTWWVVVACVPQSIGMSARADGLGPVPVLRLGPVAVIEWVSIPTVLHVDVGDHTHTLSPFRPGSMGPPPHPVGSPPHDERSNTVRFRPID